MFCSKALRQEELSLPLEGWPFLVYQPSPNWMRLTHTGQAARLPLSSHLHVHLPRNPLTNAPRIPVTQCLHTHAQAH